MLFGGEGQRNHSREAAVAAAEEIQLAIENTALRLSVGRGVDYELIALPSTTWAFGWSRHYWKMVEQYRAMSEEEGTNVDIAEDPEVELEVLYGSRQSSLGGSAGMDVSLDDAGVPAPGAEMVARLAFYSLYDEETVERFKGLFGEHDF